VDETRRGALLLKTMPRKGITNVPALGARQEGEGGGSENKNNSLRSVKWEVKLKSKWGKKRGAGAEVTARSLTRRS